MEHWLLYSTFAKQDEAFSAARSLLERRLIACANVLPGAVSLYRWEGEIRQENECVLIAKTTGDKIGQAREALVGLHPYSLPCVVAWTLPDGHSPFLQWITDEVNA